MLYPMIQWNCGKMPCSHHNRFGVVGYAGTLYMHINVKVKIDNKHELTNDHLMHRTLLSSGQWIKRHFHLHGVNYFFYYQYKYYERSVANLYTLGTVCTKYGTIYESARKFGGECNRRNGFNGHSIPAVIRDYRYVSTW